MSSDLWGFFIFMKSKGSVIMLMWVSAGQPYAVMQNGAMYQALRGLRAVFFCLFFPMLA